VDALLDFLYRPTSIGGLLYFDFAIYMIGGAFVVLGIFSAVGVIQRNRPAEHDENYRRVECATCGWTGMVSKYVKACPKCRDANFVTKN
jgi:hypothetical protein